MKRLFFLLILFSLSFVFAQDNIYQDDYIYGRGLSVASTPTNWTNVSNNYLAIDGSNADQNIGIGSHTLTATNLIAEVGTESITLTGDHINYESSAGDNNFHFQGDHVAWSGGDYYINNLLFSGNVIAHSGGTISFSNENLITTGDLSLDSDTSDLCFGASQDACINYNGFSWVFNPRSVGSGDGVLLFDWIIGNDLNVGNDLSVARDLNVSRDLRVFQQLLVNGADVVGASPFVLKQLVNNPGMVITDNAVSNPKQILMGWNTGVSQERFEINALQQGVAFKDIIIQTTSSAKVGIGLTNPSEKLDVNGNIKGFDGFFIDLFVENVNVNGSLEQINGNATINLNYGSMYQHDLDTIVDIISTNVWANVTDFNTSLNNGFYLSEDNVSLISEVDGVFEVDWGISFSDGGNTNFEGGVSVDFIVDNSTTAHRKTGTAGDDGNVGGTGIIRIESGDYVGLMMMNEDNVNDPTIAHANIKLVRIGN